MIGEAGTYCQQHNVMAKNKTFAAQNDRNGPIVKNHNIMSQIHHQDQKPENRKIPTITQKSPKSSQTICAIYSETKL